MREIEARGKKTEDAIAAGCAELGVTRDEVEVQIIQLPGLFRKAIVTKVLTIHQRRWIFILGELRS